MNDMRAVLMPKSDQINADDLVGGPITITLRAGTVLPLYKSATGKAFASFLS